MTVINDTQPELTRAVDWVIRLKDERDRLRLLLSKGLGYVEGSHLDCAKEWIEQTKKELGLE